MIRPIQYTHAIVCMAKPQTVYTRVAFMTKLQTTVFMVKPQTVCVCVYIYMVKPHSMYVGGWVGGWVWMGVCICILSVV